MKNIAYYICLAVGMVTMSGELYSIQRFFRFPSVGRQARLNYQRVVENSRAVRDSGARLIQRLELQEALHASRDQYSNRTIPMALGFAAIRIAQDQQARQRHQDLMERSRAVRRRYGQFKQRFGHEDEFKPVVDYTLD